MPPNITTAPGPQGSISYLLYNGTPLSNVLTPTIQATIPISVTPAFGQVIRDILNYIYSFPKSQRRARVLVANKLFENLFDAYRGHFGFGNFSQLRDFWYHLLQLVNSWEKKHRRLHKGLLFYWLGFAHLALSGERTGIFSPRFL